MMGGPPDDAIPEPRPTETTAELNAEQLANKLERARAIEPESWRPPDILDEYELRALIGRGAMGHVYRYWDTRLERDVAVKLVRALDEEGKAAARFHHPNVVAVYRVGEVDGRPYIAYQYVNGESLDRMVPIASRPRALHIARDLARGLAAAHEQGVVHGDIKPANAMVEQATGTAKLIDFGLARRVTEQSSPAVARPSSAGALQAPAGTAGDGDSRRVTPDSAASGDMPIGTIAYCAPELFTGVPSNLRSDVYAFGALLYELCTGRAPPAVDDRSARLDLDLVGDLFGTGLAGVVGKCLDSEPERRYPNAGEILAALDALDGSRGAVAGNPYRGLLSFERDHRELFFGRDPDIWRVVELMRGQRLVILTGASGVGKSSLVRAGVLPQLADVGFGPKRQFQACTIISGQRPVSALSHALAGLLGAADDGTDLQLEQTIRGELQARDWVAFRRRLRERKSGTVLFFDQLDDLVTLADPGEAEILCEALASLIAERTPGARVLATARIDQLAELAGLPGLGPLVERAVHLVGPLGPDAMRKTITLPARAAGVRFESDDMVDELVASVSHAEGGLPLLQFALARLWESRQDEVISRRALAAIGGVEGALAGHADRVLDGLLPDTRAAARGVLLDLVTHRGTRARPQRERLEAGSAARAEALEALIRGRLVVTGHADGAPVCEIAHEALVSAWPRLARWLEEERDNRALHQLVAHAAESWNEVGRNPDALWGRRSLRKIAALDGDELGAAERDFLAACRRAVMRSRWLAALALGTVMAAAGLVVGGISYVRGQALDERIDALVARADVELDKAHQRLDGFRSHRAAAVAALGAEPGAALTRDQREMADGAWQSALSHEASAEKSFREASRLLEQAFGLDTERRDVRQELARVLSERAVFAEERGRRAERDAMIAVLGIYDRDLERKWTDPVDIHIESEPSNARVEIVQTRGNGAAPSGVTPFSAPLAPGSYVLVLDTGVANIAVRYPLYIRPRPVLEASEAGSPGNHASGHDAIDTVRITWPDKNDLVSKSNLVYVPEGTFLFGYGASSADEEIRSFYQTVLLHERTTPAFWISPHETTYGEWLEFVEQCPDNGCAESAARLPGTKPDNYGFNIEVKHLDSTWQLSVAAAPNRRDSAVHGETLVYQHRTGTGRAHDWSRIPVSGVSSREVRAYLAWLDGSGKLPGARLCREDEWERAARGADGRGYPHGDILSPEHANYDRTYGRDVRTFGPDAVGSHPTSDSPFGLHDMTGNVWEMVDLLFIDRDSESRSSVIGVRGGSYYNSSAVASSANHWVAGVDRRSPEIGFRVCSSAR